MKKLIPKRPGTPAEPTPGIPPKFVVLTVILILEMAHSRHFGGDFRRVAGLGSSYGVAQSIRVKILPYIGSWEPYFDPRAKSAKVSNKKVPILLN